MLDPPLKIGHSDIALNDALTSLLNTWGVSLDKDLIIDMNPLGQVVGLGHEVALVTNYGTQPIVEGMKGTATGFPLSRSLEIRGTDKSSVEKLIETSASSLATPNLESAAVSVNDPKNKKGPLTIAAAANYNTGKENSQGRFVVVGSSSWAVNGFINFNGNSDLALNTINWLSSDEDLISIRPKAAGRSPHHHDPRATELGPRHQPVPAAHDRGDRRRLRLAETEINLEWWPILAALLAAGVGILT